MKSKFKSEKNKKNKHNREKDFKIDMMTVTLAFKLFGYFMYT